MSSGYNEIGRILVLKNFVSSKRGQLGDVRERRDRGGEETKRENIYINSRSVVTCTIMGFARDRICHVRDISHLIIFYIILVTVRSPQWLSSLVFCATIQISQTMFE